MKRIISALFFAVSLLFILPFTSAVSYPRDPFLVRRDGEFTWKIKGFESEVSNVSIISSSEEIQIKNSDDFPENVIEENSTNMTFEVGDAQTGIHIIGAEVEVGTGRNFYTETYFTAVGVDLPSKEVTREDMVKISERMSSIDENLTERVNDINKEEEAMKKEITKLKSNYTKLSKNLSEAEKKIQTLQRKINGDGEENTITGAFVENGSVILGLIILIAVAAYIAYRKNEEGSSSGEANSEEPQDFSPVTD